MCLTKWPFVCADTRIYFPKLTVLFARGFSLRTFSSSKVLVEKKASLSILILFRFVDSSMKDCNQTA